MFKSRVGLCGVLIGMCAAVLSGCGAGSNGTAHPLPVAGKQGIVHGGEEPVSGATIQLYAVGTNANGAPATPLISSAVLTDANGNFTITGKYTCPSASALVYSTATGGNPGLPVGTNNNALALMAALGPCSTLSPSTFISLNELTTVAAVYALTPYMTSLSSVGSDSGNATALANAFALANELVNTTTGTAPGLNVPAGTLVPIQQINTVADILASCVNTGGGVAGDNSACGNLFSLTTIPAGSTAPANTAAALLVIANHPTVNTAALYNLVPATAPFQPAQSQVPPDLAVRLLSNAGLTVSPTVLNFPATPIYISTQPPQTVTFTNNTSAPIGLDAVDPENFSIVGGDAGSFTVASTPSSVCYSPLLPGATCSVQIAFKPSTTGPQSAFYVIPNSSANPSIGISLTGTGVPRTGSQATFNPSPLDFQAAATPAPITLTNTGIAPLNVYSISISNDPASGQPAFTQTNTCGVPIAAGGTCTISITALGTAQPFATGVLTVYDDAPGSPEAIHLSFSDGVQIDFPSLAVGTSFTQYFQGDNLQNYPDPINLTITGAEASDFSFSTTSSVLTTTCVATRPPSLCTNAVTFTPSAQGVRTATLNAFGDLANGALGSLTGVGLPPGPHIAFLQAYTPPENVAAITSLSFPFQVVQGQSGSATATILNNGSVPLTLNAPAISGPAASEFSDTTTCPSLLPPGGTCTLNGGVIPAQPGIRNATLTLTDTTNAVSATLSLQATGLTPPPAVNPSLLDFPYTPVGTVSAPLSFTITANNNDPVFLKMDPATASLDPFVISGSSSCPQTPCQLSVVYEPTSATSTDPGGQNGGYVVIYDQTTYALTYVLLSGAYLPPFVISVTPNSIDFGDQPVGTTSTSQTITVTNVGSQSLNFSPAFDPSGTMTRDANFAVSQTPQGFSINPAQSVTLNVAFSPFIPGPAAATLYILSNAPTSPTAVQLSGTGR